MEVQGILKVKMDTERVSDRFQKREFVLTTESSTPYPQHVTFQVTQDKCAILDRFNEGTELVVQFNLRGREWNGPKGTKFFNTLEAWRIVDVQSEYNHAAQQSAQAAHQAMGEPDNDDLPF